MPFHIRKNGEPAKCVASPGECPLGSVKHYENEKDARTAYEKQQDNSPRSLSKKSLILSDIDGTLVRSSLVLSNAVELHNSGALNLGKSAGLWQSDMKNEIYVRDLADAYRQSLSGRTMAFVKAEDTVRHMLAQEHNFYSTLKRLVEYKKQGHDVVLISGSPDFLVGPLAKHFGFKGHGSTYHMDTDGKFTGKIDLMSGAEAKEAVIKDLNLSKYDTIIGIGDTTSDSPLLEASEHSILVDPTHDTIRELSERNIEIDEIITH